jgi:hypothetical protein
MKCSKEIKLSLASLHKILFKYDQRIFLGTPDLDESCQSLLLFCTNVSSYRTATNNFVKNNLLLTAFVVYRLEFLATDPEVQVRFPALTDFLRSSGSGTGYTQPCEHNWWATWNKK